MCFGGRGFGWSLNTAALAFWKSASERGSMCVLAGGFGGKINSLRILEERVRADDVGDERRDVGGVDVPEIIRGCEGSDQV